jgi:hypothetical protein
MAPPRRAPTLSNVIKLSLDPVTFDRLKAEAGRRRDTMERTAYAILQQALPASEPPPTATPYELPEMDLSFLSRPPRTPTNR